ncbi:MAG: TolC family protein, partial [Akkermansiaceae bacterium]|nr:TolC family protein [Akkermansiaceae bacterium]
LNWETQSQQWQVETQRYRVLTDVRQRFYEALAAQRRLQVATDFEQVAIKGVRNAAARQEALEASRPEFLQAEIQLKQVELQRRQAQPQYPLRTITAALSACNRVMQRNGPTPRSEQPCR